MANNLNNFQFPYFLTHPPPPPLHPISPPPPPPHPTSPPPHLHPPPPPPHPHPPPYVPPPSPPHNYIIIIFIFSTFGCILLGIAILAFCSCFLKKKKKSTMIIEEKEVKHIDDHVKMKEAIVEGPHGKLETIVLSIEEDLHEKDDIISRAVNMG
ncbi:protein TRACHEARY ELEMENT DIFFERENTIATION-RELATED 7A-like [Solanum stenotomum]|uniref:protein TRACHEARY ELEMENT DIFFERENTIATION-RELATED 7A-like n=1 Tax=Solanum stenotomum TaxID=172797 RepID=UPI0020D0BCAE|nr:protein TRACHEARY ELEMENT DIFFERENTIATION-RELATED 7A-like [Solanum stenotomum]